MVLDPVPGTPLMDFTAGRVLFLKSLPVVNTRGARFTCTPQLPPLHRVLWIYTDGNGTEACSLVDIDLSSCAIESLVDSNK